jgi:FkbM family methyltransferase
LVNPKRYIAGRLRRIAMSAAEDRLGPEIAALRREVTALATAQSDRAATPLPNLPLPDGYTLIDIAHPGLPPFRLVVSAQSNSYEAAIACGWVNDVTPLVIELLGGRGALIDIGANIGTVSVPVAATGSNVFAIEMLPENALKLSLSVLANVMPNLRVMQAALSVAEGLLHYSGSGPWGQVTNKADGQTAACYRLDTVVALLGLNDPNFLTTTPLVVKLDVEGHDYEVLRGATSLLTTRRPVLIVESIEEREFIAGYARKAKRLLASYNYRLFMVRNHVLAPCGPNDIQDGWLTDILAVPAEFEGNILTSMPHRQVRDFTREERLEVIGYFASSQYAEQRLYSAWALAMRWREDPTLAIDAMPLSNALLADPDPEVAAGAARYLDAAHTKPRE